MITNDTLSSIQFASLEHLASASVVTNQAATLVALPSLVSVDGDLTIIHNRALESIDLPRLTTVGGILGIGNNSPLTSIRCSSPSICPG